MRQIGLFGKYLNDEQPFIWPDQKTMNAMPADIHVTKIVLKNNNAQSISYVQFFYSDGTKSPVCENKQGGKVFDNTLVLDEVDRPIKKVKGCGADEYVNWVSFEDASGTQIAKYDP